MTVTHYVIVTKDCESDYLDTLTGPFASYDAAMDHFVTMPPASHYAHKYIAEIHAPTQSN